MAKRPPSYRPGPVTVMRSNWGRRERGTAQERGYGWAWKKLRLIILKRDRGLCRMCLALGRRVIATDVDHITPKAKGGTDDHHNLQALCADCHKAKTARERVTGRGG